MTYRVVLLKGAQAELRDLYHNYLVSNFGVDVAREKYAAIKKSVDLLKAHPEMGKPIPELTETGFEHYRQMVVENLNKIIYQIDDGKMIVYVHVFCSTRQDFETILRVRLLGG
ncbi:type II toxin-antitoxin system RelE/ParE family toxin [Noviherbaspirillum cavernae]|uniref:Type II toxin-antitoxin system RelE/ParE family toxin n=1 Tax=Noviherbaspirillum cavernae TaxID=2320862 RepID=A0A418X4T7_9BURK|nr:type II toxin-antitoxin system RelE/ParE family toxin [Noviherbaspirillum cavernae]RJG07498.1 type II toxin-antitoxin system RelE/ParE family toxin [Noviherbaspirillum cavernae]